jgi:hypothetical protein
MRKIRIPRKKKKWYYRDNYVNVGFSFGIPYTEEQYDFETEECEMFKPIKQ